jgi:hypothetical protein
MLTFKNNSLTLMVEQSSGQWRDIGRIENISSAYVSGQLRQAQSSNQGKRVKAVDADGRLIDMLG